MKNIAVIGCTGSIGTQTLDIVRHNRDKYKVVGLSCAENAELLAELAVEFDCGTLGIANPEKYGALKAALPRAEIYTGERALDAPAENADTVVVAVVGMIGIRAVLYALEHGKTVALANKESLVAGGELVMRLIESGKGKICPVDSEHSAVWQALRGEKDYKRIILTASGGPFLNTPKSALAEITPEQAVKHPNWRMGKKISIDSATMMNKGLEIIEARWLFDTQSIDYVIHPESVVHSMVEFADGSIKAQASFPDMRLPIQYALTYPDHAPREYKPIELPLALNFFAPDENKFPAPKLAKAALAAGGNAPIVLNAANEAAVALFSERKIPFTGIVSAVEHALETEPVAPVKTVDDIFATHNRVYDKIYLDYRNVR